MQRMDQNHLNSFGRGPPKDHLCEIISKLDSGFRRGCHLSQFLTDGRRQTKTDPKSSPCHYVTGELKTMLNPHEHEIYDRDKWHCDIYEDYKFHAQML